MFLLHVVYVIVTKKVVTNIHKFECIVQSLATKQFFRSVYHFVVYALQFKCPCTQCTIHLSVYEIESTLLLELL